MPGAETVPLDRALCRVLAEDVAADRDLPPFHRAIRDGYAVRAADLIDLPAVLWCVGEVPAGRSFEGEVRPGQCVSIMTGAPVPEGADAVVMVEHTVRAPAMSKSSAAFSRGKTSCCAGVKRHRVRESWGAAGAFKPRRSACWLRWARQPSPFTESPAWRFYLRAMKWCPLSRPPQWFQVRNSNAAALAAQLNPQQACRCNWVSLLIATTPSKR